MSESLVPIAHAKQDGVGQWAEPHDLVEHLLAVAGMAAEFAAAFGPQWAELAGRWHDLGKYRARFQRYIRLVTGFDVNAHITGEAGKAPHSTAGALWACQQLKLPGRVLAYLIAGHHAGLYDWDGGLEVRLQDGQQELDEALAAHPSSRVLDCCGFSGSLRDVPGGKDGFSLWVRMLFSALVDADFLDTERYMDPQRFHRRNAWPTPQALLPQFDAYMRAKADGPPSAVNRVRADVLAQCRAAAVCSPGVFSLTVPTGGGKTLSGMAFALEHAKTHHKRRIVLAIPYTSIIEQTAQVMRDIFGDAVIEHHSNVEVDASQETSASRLACENWDAPVVVTTNVQLFESLFAARTSRCRKLHNLVNSVIVLDEAQLLPPAFLQPILDVLRLLTLHYGVTVVLSTATQPALSTPQNFDARQQLRGLGSVREIMTDPDSLYAALDRVQVRLPSNWQTPITWASLADEVSQWPCVLVVVNTRQDARELWSLMPAGTVHLSALMCGAHRSEVIASVKRRVLAGEPVRVVSTSLIEAGVDLDMPVVYRALAGLDSIAQAAGRCNREGRLPGKGRVVVFVPPKPAPAGLMRMAQQACMAVLHDLPEQPLTRDRFESYFQRLYHDVGNLDEQQICADLRMAYGKLDGATLAVNFRTAAEKFRLVDDEGQAAVVVRYLGLDGAQDKVNALLGLLHSQGPSRWLLRQLQRYVVTAPQRQVQQLQLQGALAEVMPGLYVQISSWLYDNDLGLNLDSRPVSASQCVV